MTLLCSIERHMKRTGLTATQFGRSAVNDPRLVRDLRNGRQPGQRLVERVQAYMAAADTELG